MDRNIRRSFILFLCMLLLYTSVFCIAVSADNATLVRIGVYENPPKIFTDENGNVSGFWADTIDYIASEEGWEIEYIHGTWAQCMERLETGEIDMMPDVAYTEERGSLYDFSKETVYSSWSRVYAREGTEIQSILDLEGKNVAVLKGSVNVEGPEGIKNLVAEFDVTCTFIETDSYARVFELVKSGEADAGVTSKDFGNRHEKDYNVMKTAVIFQPSLLYFAFPKESDLTPYFIERIDYHMKELKEDPHSVYYQSLEDWLGVKSVGKPVIPGWMQWLLIGIGGLVILLAAGSYILRSQVKSRTRKLAEEIVERKQIQERLNHLNLVLYGIRKVNQLITQEKSRERLIKTTCESLVSTRGYYNAWIALLDESKSVISYAEAGTGKAFLPLGEQLQKNELPVCSKKALRKTGVVVIQDTCSDCKDCPLKQWHASRVTVTCRLEHSGTVHGSLTVSGPANLASDEEELSLFKEVAADIGLGLGTIQQEQALRESEEKYRALFEGSPEGILIADIEKRQFLYANPAICNMLGYSVEELTQMKVGDIHPESALEYVIVEFEAQARGEKTLVADIPCLKRDGTIFYADIDTAKVSIAGKEYNIGFFRDVTERKRTAEVIQDSAEKLRLTFESVTEGITITDLNGTIVDTNEAAVRMHGYESKEQLLGRSAFELIAESDHDRAGENLKRTLEEKQTGNVEYTLVRKDGSEFSGELAASLIKDTSGNPLRFVAITRDITERKQMEKELRESEARFRSIVETTKEWIWMMDVDGRMTYNNPTIEQILGYSPGELLEQPTLDYMYEEDRHKIEQMLPELIAEKRGWTNLVVRWHCKDGTLRWLESNAAPILDSKGQLIGYQGADRDITERKQVDEALKESEERYRHIFERSPLGIGLSSMDGKVVIANKAMQDITGYSYEELTKINLAETFKNEDREALIEAINKHGSVVDYLAQLKRKDGTVYDSLLTVTKINIGGKDFLHSIQQDITERKKAEEAMADDAVRRRILIEQSSDGIVILDQDGKVYEANRRFAEMLGYSIEEVSELHVWDWEFQYSPEQVRDMLRSVDETGDHFETVHRRKDGSVYDVEISTNGAVYQGQKLIFCVCRDITQRKRAEKLFHDMFTGSSIAMYVAQDGKFKLVNPQFLKDTEYTENELLGVSPDMVIFQEDRQSVRENAIAMLKGQHDYPYEYRYLTRSGQIKWASESVASINYDGKKATFGTSMDITELKKLEQEVLMSSKLASVGELASGVAHEINNPLSSVVGFSQLLMERTDVPSSIKEDLNKIYNESQRVVKIVQKLLQFSRKYKPEKSDVDIVDLITKTVDLRTYELNIENISVTIDYDDAILLIRANYNELQQAILNIIINAEQALSEVERRGKISISIGKDETHVILTISDNGPGIKDSDLLDIFNPFFTTKSVGSGTGLGLYICHNIITGHNGTIDVESKAGKGTTFTIKLPIARDDEDIIVEKPIKEKISPMTKHKKTGTILIAEDEPIICDILSKILSEEGHTVHTAPDGKDALQKLNKRDYDIYVIDLKMPGISGMELYALLKDKSSMLTHKVIFMTGDVITANTDDFLTSEGRPYLTKPFDYRELIELIQEVMEDEQGK